MKSTVLAGERCENRNGPEGKFLVAAGSPQCSNAGNAEAQKKLYREHFPSY
jgi:hypothetical protein